MQPLNNEDQKPRTNNRYDSLADKMIEDDITFHQYGTTDDETTTNQRITWTKDWTNTKTTNSICSHPKTNFRTVFDLNHKIKDKNDFPLILKY